MRPIRYIRDLLGIKTSRYMKYDGSGETSSIAQRLAAITVSSLMATCSNDSSTFSTYSGKFHELSDIIIGVLVMNIFDMIFGDASAAHQAIEAVNEMVEDFHKALSTELNITTCYDY